MTKASTTTRPAVLDSKEQPLELRMRVVLLGEKDRDEAGKPRLGTVVNLEHQRARVVIAVDGVDKLAVRKATATRIKKNKSGKIERVPAPERKRAAVNA